MPEPGSGVKTRLPHDAPLNELPAARILEAIADAAARWCDADFPDRVRATRRIVERTGYSEPVVEYALDRLFEDFTREHFRTAIERELGLLEALDGFAPRPGGGEVWYRPAGSVTIVSSDTTIGVALPALAFAAIAKCAVVVKDRSDEFVAAFVRTLKEERKAFESIAVGRWEGHFGRAAPEAALGEVLARCNVVVAFGGAPALHAIRSRVGPETLFVPFGHRTSVAYVAAADLASESSAEACALGVARDVLLYDGDGCLSVHAIFVEEGGAVGPEAFARILAAALERTCREFPGRPLGAGSGTLVYERGARFRAAQDASRVFGGAEAGYTLAYDASRDEPPPLFRRTAALLPVASPAEALDYLRRHAVPLEGLSLSRAARVARDDLTRFAMHCGASRVAGFGELQSPSVAHEHGGEPRIRHFVRAVVRE